VRRPEALEIVDLAARLLGPLREEVVFVGGSVLGFLVTAPGSRKPRLTDDADVIVEATTKIQYHGVEERLRNLGFQHDQYGPICRFLQGGLVLDVMPVEESVLGFSNRWYPLCFTNWQWRSTSSGLRVKVIISPCFLACKFDAFSSPGREGAGDYLASRDFEDIVSVIEGCSELEEEILGCPPEIKQYLSEQARTLLAEREILFWIEGCLDPDTESQARADFVMSRLALLAGLSASS
jgi:hypothetical protein